jgi:ATP-dependent Clp protease adaptor protein ClpS
MTRPDTPDFRVSTETETHEQTRTRRIPPYHVILLNDDHHSQDFVVAVLMKVLGCAAENAFQMMMEAHNSGRCVIWTGTREVAELKAEQLQTFHETRDNGQELGPLGCVIEPAPAP